MSDDLTDRLDEATDEPPSEDVSVGITAEAMPSLETQMDEAGRGSIGMLTGMANVSDPKTDEPLGELLFGLDASIWFHHADGRRARFDPDALASAALEAIDASAFEPEED